MQFLTVIPTNNVPSQNRGYSEIMHCGILLSMPHLIILKKFQSLIWIQGGLNSNNDTV